MTGEQWHDTTVAAVDIARIAGVGRAAVGNWRRRFADFPEPVGGTASSPLYRLGDVERWLRDHDRIVDVAPVDRVWQWLRTEVDDLRLATLVGRLGAFVIFLRRAPGVWAELAGQSDELLAGHLAPAVATAVPELPDAFPERPAPDLVAVLRTLAGVVADTGGPAAFGFLVERLLEAHFRRLSLTGAGIAALAAQLAGVRGAHVLDPAAGTGALLLAATAAGGSAVSAQDVDPAAVRLAGARLLLDDVPVAAAVGDSLGADAFAGRRFGAVLCDPPSGDRGWNLDELAGDPRWRYGLPPRTEAELAWVQHCLEHAEPGGGVVVLMPPAAAGRRSGRRIRGNLLRAGVLRAVVGVVAEGTATDLWVLSGADPAATPPSHVLFVTAAEPADALRAWTAFLQDTAHSDVHSRAVPVLNLLDEDVDLSPQRHVRAGAGADAGDFATLRAEVTAALATLAAGVPDLAVATGSRPLAMTSVGDLIKAGAVAQLQAPLRIEVDGGTGRPALTAKDVAEGREPTGRAVDQPGLVVLAAGDVVTPALAAKGGAVRVVDSGGAVLGPRLLAFRADPRQLDPDFFAGFLRLAAEPGAGRSGSTRTDARRVPIPLVPLAEQQAYGAAFRALESFRAVLRACERQGGELVRIGAAGLAAGILDPGRRDG